MVLCLSCGEKFVVLYVWDPLTKRVAVKLVTRAIVNQFLPAFDFDFLSTSQEIGWKEHLRYDLFSVEWDLKP